MEYVQAQNCWAQLLKLSDPSTGPYQGPWHLQPSLGSGSAGCGGCKVSCHSWKGFTCQSLMDPPSIRDILDGDLPFLLSLVLVPWAYDANPGLFSSQPLSLLQCLPLKYSQTLVTVVLSSTGFW